MKTAILTIAACLLSSHGFSQQDVVDQLEQQLEREIGTPEPEKQDSEKFPKIGDSAEPRAETGDLFESIEKVASSIDTKLMILSEKIDELERQVRDQHNLKGQVTITLVIPKATHWKFSSISAKINEISLMSHDSSTASMATNNSVMIFKGPLPVGKHNLSLEISLTGSRGEKNSQSKIIAKNYEISHINGSNNQSVVLTVTDAKGSAPRLKFTSSVDKSSKM